MRKMPAFIFSLSRNQRCLTRWADTTALGAARNIGNVNQCSIRRVQAKGDEIQIDSHRCILGFLMLSRENQIKV